MNKTKKIVIFNKQTGNVQCALDSEELLEKYNKEDYIAKEIWLGENEYYFGDYKTGQVYNFVEKPLVYERDLLDQTYREILQHYPLYRQINAIVDVIEANENLLKPESYKNFISFLKKAKFKHNMKIKSLSSDKEAFNFVSNQQLIEAYTKDAEYAFQKDTE